VRNSYRNSSACYIKYPEAYSWGVGEYDSEDGCDGCREGI